MWQTNAKKCSKKPKSTQNGKKKPKNLPNNVFVFFVLAFGVFLLSKHYWWKYVGRLMPKSAHKNQKIKKRQKVPKMAKKSQKLTEQCFRILSPCLWSLSIVETLLRHQHWKDNAKNWLKQPKMSQNGKKIVRLTK